MITFIGYECRSIENAEEFINQATVPSNYKDPVKIQEYIEKAKLKKLSEAAYRPLTGIVTKISTAVYTSPTRPFDYKSYDMSSPEESEDFINSIFPFNKGLTSVVAINPVNLFNILRFNLNGLRGMGNFGFLNKEGLIRVKTIDPFSLLLPNYEFIDIELICRRLHIALPCGWDSNSEDQLKLLISVSNLAEIATLTY